ncbi:hypothetical protein CPB85DRAFT_492709 [Mucidula mucida]|nr:hypothetical protein CPB85DRAFT_492709 [Mucidula mucida]
MGFRRFLCCASNKKDIAADIDDINENSRLIPAAEEPLPPTTTFDYGKFEQRLGTIVNAKAGRMVNVNAQGFQNGDRASSIMGDDGDERHASRKPSRSSSRSTGGGRMTLSARLVSPDEEEPEQTRPKDIHVAAPPNMILNVGSLSRSWGD